jgi:hypothetical protein
MRALRDRAARAGSETKSRKTATAVRSIRQSNPRLDGLGEAGY